MGKKGEGGGDVFAAQEEGLAGCLCLNCFPGGSQTRQALLLLQGSGFEESAVLLEFHLAMAKQVLQKERVMSQVVRAVRKMAGCSPSPSAPCSYSPALPEEPGAGRVRRSLLVPNAPAAAGPRPRPGTAGSSTGM